MMLRVKGIIEDSDSNKIQILITGNGCNRPCDQVYIAASLLITELRHKRFINKFAFSHRPSPSGRGSLTFVLQNLFGL